MSNTILKNKGIKTTNGREIVLNIVKDCAEPVTIKTIKEKCKELLNIDLSTIYRILDLYIEKNIFIKTSDCDGNFYYELKTDKHKHFIRCIKCNEKTVIDNCPIENISNNIFKQTGYIISEHNLQLQGTCNKCSKVD